MAFNSQIKGYMTFGKSFSRGGAFPLEAYEIWTDYDALVAYAANTDPAKDPSYIGQKVAYVDIANNKVTHYSIEIDGTLKEIGAATNGDGFTIDLVNGVLSLHGINDEATVAGMLPQVEVVDGKKGIKWVPISEVVKGDGNKITTLTSSDGSVIIEATTDTDSSLVYDLKVTHPAVPVYAITSERNADDNATIYHLTKDSENVEKEIIVPDAYDDTALAGRVKTLEDAGYQTASDVSTAITNGIADKADKAETLAGYGITDAYTKTEVDTELGKKATQTDLEALEGRVDSFLTGTGTEAALDSLQELITYINEHDDVELADIIADVEALQTKVDTGDQKVSEYVTAAINALKIGDYAKAADLTALAGRVEALEAKPFDTYATKDEVSAKVSTEDYEADKATFAIAETVNADLAKKVDTETYTADKATFAVTSEVANTYATKQFIGEIPSDADATTIIGYINEKAQEVLDSATGGSSESAASVKQQLDSYKAANDPKVNALLAEVYGTPAEGEEYNYAADSRLDTLEKADAAQDALIESNTTLAQKGVDDAAAAALAVTNLASGQVAQNKNDIAAVKDVVNGEDNENSHAKRIAKLEAHDLTHAEEYTALNTKVGENTTAIAKKADAENVYTKSEADALINAKANAADVYVKGDVYTKTETDNAIAAAVAGADLSSYAKVTDVEAIYKAGVDGGAATGVLADEIARATAAEKANADAITAIVGEDSGKTIRTIAAEETAEIVAGADAKYDTLKEIADFIMNDETGAAAMANDIAALKTTVGDDTSGLIKSVSDNADAIAAIVQPKESTEISVADDGTIGIKEMNVNKLVQTEGDVFIIDGGSAK